MPCLLLLSLLTVAQAQENFSEELDADLAAAFQNLTIGQNVSANLTEPNSFDTFISDAEQDFNEAASLNNEEIEWILGQAREEFLQKRDKK